MHIYRRHLTLALIIAIFTAVAYARSQEKTQPLPISTWKLPATLSFCGEGVPLDDPEVRERAEREFYVNVQTPGQIILYIKRAARYFPMYQRVMREMGMPEDLCYLSVAESALFMARSSKDAVGLWQFIPSTGRAMGLRIDEYVDERRHPEKSTRAAMRYLKLGYDSIGSWTGAAAGYNMGHTRFAENTTYQGTTNFYELYLNEETSRYILRIAIVKYLMMNAEEFGIVVPEKERYTATATRVVAVESEIKNLAAWAAEQGTTYMDVRVLNPWILNRSLPAPSPGRPWQIEVPVR
jgi:hypothetical protein